MVLMKAHQTPRTRKAASRLLNRRQEAAGKLTFYREPIAGSNGRLRRYPRMLSTQMRAKFTHSDRLPPP